MRFLLTILVAAFSMTATTLEKLTLDQMIAKSTAIVRGTVSFSHVQQHGAIYYTHYKVSVLERLKGPDTKTIDVVLPGGTLGRTQQTFSGVPVLPSTGEVALFLWTSKTGLTHVIGLSQGILQVSKDAAGQLVLSRDAIREGMTDPRTGRAAEDPGIRMTMTEFAARVRSAGGSTR